MAAFCIILLLSTQGIPSNGGDYRNKKKQGFDPCSYVSVCTAIIVQVCVSWIFRGSPDSGPGKSMVRGAGLQFRADLLRSTVRSGLFICTNGEMQTNCGMDPAIFEI